MERKAIRRRVASAVRGVIEQLEARTLLAAVGPDGFGYVADATAFEAIDLVAGAAGVVTVMGSSPGSGDDAKSIDLGDNTFTFYSGKYTGNDQLFVSDNGLISFRYGQDEDINTDLAASPFERSIEVLWDDWEASFELIDQQVLAQLQNTGGSAAPDRLVIEWNAVSYNESVTPVKFQAILQLNTGDTPGTVILNYPDVDTGSASTTRASRATVGIKDFGAQGPNRLLISQDNGANPLIDNGKAILISNSATGQARANAGADPSITEGSSIGLDASATTDPNQSAASLTYAWDFDGDGNYGETGIANAQFGDEVGITPTFNGNTGLNTQVALRVTDSTGQTSFDGITIQVTNIRPKVNVTAPTTALVDVRFKITMTATDLSQNVQYHFDVFWGNDTSFGDYGSGDGTEATQIYSEQGTYTVSVTATDSAGKSSKPYTFQITVGPRPDVLLNYDGTLIVTTGDQNDVITLDSTGGNARLNRNGVVTTYPLANVKSFDVESGGGNDAITLDLNIEQLVMSGAGDDVIVANNELESNIDAGDGNDSITTGTGPDSIVGGEGNNTINGGGGPDLISAGDGDDVITAGIAPNIDAGGGNNRVETTSGFIRTGDGADTIIGGEGDDFGGVRIESGDGDDSITTGVRGDDINAGGGNDTVSSGDGDDTITSLGNPTTGIGAVINSGNGRDTILPFFARLILTGSGDDFISANFALKIDAGGGNDLVRAAGSREFPVVIVGGDGSDNIFTGDGNDRIYGGAGSDTVHAGNGSDLLSGGGGNDKLFGQGGADRLYGGNGNDRLEGQGGNDRFLGGAGADLVRGGSGINTRRDDDAADILEDIAN